MTMVSWGATVVQCMNAIEQSGRDIELIDLRTINPMDFAPIAKSVEKTGRAVICHEAPRNCGVGAELAARSADPDDIPKATNYVKTAMTALAAGETPNPATTKPYGCSVKY